MMDDLKHAYEGVDDLKDFTKESLTNYRALLVSKSIPQLYLMTQLKNGRLGSVLEIGCGNGRTLLTGAVYGQLKTGVGVDLSASRIGFARDWAKEECEDDRLDFISCSIFDIEPKPVYDTVICITGAFQYFEPQGRKDQLLEYIRHSLRPGGGAILELYDIPEERRKLLELSSHLQTWYELPPEDPWRFYLESFDLEPNDIVTHKKTFVSRDGRIDEGRVERLKYYRYQDLDDMFTGDYEVIVQDNAKWIHWRL